MRIPIIPTFVGAVLLIAVAALKLAPYPDAIRLSVTECTFQKTPYWCEDKGDNVVLHFVNADGGVGRKAEVISRREYNLDRANQGHLARSIDRD